MKETKNPNRKNLGNTTERRSNIHGKLLNYINIKGRKEDRSLQKILGTEGRNLKHNKKAQVGGRENIEIKEYE